MVNYIEFPSSIRGFPSRIRALFPGWRTQTVQVGRRPCSWPRYPRPPRLPGNRQVTAILGQRNTKNTANPIQTGISKQMEICFFTYLGPICCIGLDSERW